jgi:DNA repair exonuclease SbcCD ATPase subunit
MPTSKLWLEHTERAAWDSVEALRERLVRAEARLEALASGAKRLPQLLDLLDEAKQKFAPDARSHHEIVEALLKRIERLQGEVDAAHAPEPRPVSFSAPPPRPRLDSDDFAMRGPTADDDLDLADFAKAMQRRAEDDEPTRDLNRLLTAAEHKLDDLTELEGAALREAALELAILAARIFGASKAEA